MSKIEKNGWWSYFSDKEQEDIQAASPSEIAVYLLQYPDLSLRFIHDLVAHNQAQKALDALNSIFPEGGKQELVTGLVKKLPEELIYYKETNLPIEEREWHAEYIPFILNLAFNGFESILFPEEKRLVDAYTKIRLHAINTREQAREHGLLE